MALGMVQAKCMTPWAKLRSVITQHMNAHNEYYRNQLQDWEFVEYEVVEREVRQLIDVVDKKKVWEILKR